MQKSRHTVVCRAAQESGLPHHEYIDRKTHLLFFIIITGQTVFTDYSQRGNYKGEHMYD